MVHKKHEAAAFAALDSRAAASTASLQDGSERDGLLAALKSLKLHTDAESSYDMHAVLHFCEVWTYLPIMNDETGSFGVLAFPPGGGVYLLDR